MSAKLLDAKGHAVTRIFRNVRNLTYLAYMRVKGRLAGHGLGKIGVVHRFSRWLEVNVSSTWKPSTIRLQGITLKLNPNDQSISDRMIQTGIWEKLETEVIRREVREGDVVVDVGANIGYYTLIGAQSVGRKGKVFAFEPEPYNFSLLEDNVAINKYANVVLICAAVSNKSGNLRLYLSGENPGNHRSYDSSDGREFIDVEAVSLDDYFSAFEGEIGLIKMDVEGAEGWVIQGMPLLLKRYPRLKIITEFWPFGLAKSGVEPETYLNTITQHGFVLHNIDDEKNGTELTSVAQLLSRYTVDNHRYTNLLCVKPDQPR